MLPSGLPERVADEEELARFLTSSSHYNSKMVKPVVFLPEPNDRETSMFRHCADPREDLWEIGDKYAAQGRTIHGAGIVAAGIVRGIPLDVVAEEPPPKHAAIRGWPWIENDPELQKAQQKERAIVLASHAELIRR